jgi:ribonuclease P protein component
MHAVPRAVQDSRFSNTAVPAKFNATQRLLRTDGFGRVINAENIADRNFKVFYLASGRKEARLGIIASKKTLSRAVDRNRAKRIIRETFRQHKIRFRRLDLVVMIRRAYAQECGSARDNLETLFSRLENRCAEL